MPSYQSKSKSVTPKSTQDTNRAVIRNPYLSFSTSRASFPNTSQVLRPPCLLESVDLRGSSNLTVQGFPIFPRSFCDPVSPIVPVCCYQPLLTRVRLSPPFYGQSVVRPCVLNFNSTMCCENYQIQSCMAPRALGRSFHYVKPHGPLPYCSPSVYSGPQYHSNHLSDNHRFKVDYSVFQNSTPKRKRRFKYTKEQVLKFQEFHSHVETVECVIPKSKSTSYDAYWSKEDLKNGIENGKLISGIIRINPKNIQESYVKHPVGSVDIYIPSLVARNRSLPDDVVAVLIEPRRNWRVFDSFLDQTTTPNKMSNEGRKYMTLERFVKDHPNKLQKLLGPTLAESILEDLDSVNDPILLETEGDTVISYAPWWVVLQRTARVVAIVHPLHPRTFIGELKVLKVKNKSKRSNIECCDESIDGVNPDSMEGLSSEVGGNQLSDWKFAKVVPVDTRLPFIFIPRNDCPQDFQKDPSSFTGVRFVGQITEWADHNLFPKGQLLRSIASDSSKVIENETDRILVGAGYVLGADAALKFSESVNQSAQESVSHAHLHSEEELNYRRDFRAYCLFTIDPSTARDLDDALHIRKLDQQEIETLSSEGYSEAFYEVGVHIADVSYFVKPDTPLDVEASRRATSIYLVNLCVPMLPRVLCEEKCSLNPGEDKLSFSVVFTVTSNAKILKIWFGRTIIRSCCKLNYEDAQDLIDNLDQKCLSETSLNVEKPHTLKDVFESVVNLNKLAIQMRRNRMNLGTLRLDQIKPVFSLNDDNGLPNGVSPYLSKPSCWLVEEWMLAANQAVAERLAKYLPKTAFLRRHPPPSLRQLYNAVSNLAAAGVDVNPDSVETIQASLSHVAGCSVDVPYQCFGSLPELCQEYVLKFPLTEKDIVEKLETLVINSTGRIEEKFCTKSLEHEVKILVTVSFLIKSMNLALYFCLSALPEGVSTKHYALNMNLYTHFTSPIRRFADIIVHRQLAQTLADDAIKEKNEKKAAWYLKTAYSIEISPDILQAQAEVCNAKKSSARLAYEDSAELFFVLLVKEVGPLTEVCTVTNVLDGAFDVIILSCGIVKRVYIQNLDLKGFEAILPRYVAGKLVDLGKLCLFWNVGSNNDEAEPLSSKEDHAEKGPLLSCGCFYTEIKLFDIVRCSVEIAPTCDQSNSFLPKLILTLLRPTCNSCQNV